MRHGPETVRNTIAIKSVIFDLGGVLLEWKPHEVLSRWSPEIEKQELMRTALMRHSDWIAFDRGELSEPDLITRVQARTDFTAQELAGFLDTVRDSLTAVPDMVALLDEVKQYGVALYCLSNMPAPIFSHVRQRYGFWNRFEGIVVSGDIRMIKPDRAIFEYVLSRHGLASHESLFIDDLPQNIDAAREIGMETLLFESPGHCRKMLTASLRPRP